MKKIRFMLVFILVSIYLCACTGNVDEDITTQQSEESFPASEDRNDEETSSAGEDEHPRETEEDESKKADEFIASTDLETHYTHSVGDAYNLYYIDEHKTLWGAGRNEYGQLGQGFQSEDFLKEAVKIAEGVVHVDYSTQGFAIFLTEDNKLYGMGNTGRGALRELQRFTREQYLYGREYTVTTPKLLMEDVVYAVCGRDDIVAMDQEGSVWTWGYNEKGNCGIAGETVVSAPVRVAEDVSMVWTGKADNGFDCRDITLLHGGYETGIENTIIEKLDGSKWICGANVGTAEKECPVYYGSAYTYRIAYTHEFRPYDRYQPVEDTGLPEGVVEARVKVYPFNYTDVREATSPGVPDWEWEFDFCQVFTDHITQNSFEFEIWEISRRKEGRKKKLVVPKSTAYFIEDGRKAVYQGDTVTLYFWFEEEQFDPILGYMEITGMKILEGNKYVNGSIPGREVG